MQHGGDLSEAMKQYGQADGAPWLDLSTGINPHAYPFEGALELSDWTSLPTASRHKALLDAARRAYRVPQGVDVVAASGTEALISLLPLLAPPGAVAVAGPTYGSHEMSWSQSGHAVQTLSWRAIAESDAAIKIIVRPNNPDGHLVAREQLVALAQAAHRIGGWLIIDEAFVDLCPSETVVELAFDHPVIVLRSFGKFYGLAGLRLGFACARPDLANRLRTTLGGWAVSGPALAIGATALADEAWAAAMRARLADEQAALDAILIRHGIEIVGGTSLYRLVRCGDAVALHDKLARQRIWTRWFGWDRSLLRIGLPPDSAGYARLDAALR